MTHVVVLLGGQSLTHIFSSVIPTIYQGSNYLNTLHIFILQLFQSLGRDEGGQIFFHYLLHHLWVTHHVWAAKSTSFMINTLLNSSNMC